jgi:F0F1-type ATP synthase assembly protein I
LERTSPGTSPAPTPRGPRRKSLEELGRLGTLGLTFAASIAVFGGAGYWLDGRLGTWPTFLIVGVFLGATGGFIYIVRAVK